MADLDNILIFMKVAQFESISRAARLMLSYCATFTKMATLSRSAMAPLCH